MPPQSVFGVATQPTAHARALRVDLLPPNVTNLLAFPGAEFADKARVLPNGSVLVSTYSSSSLITLDVEPLGSVVRTLATDSWVGETHCNASVCYAIQMPNYPEDGPLDLVRFDVATGHVETVKSYGLNYTGYQPDVNTVDWQNGYFHAGLLADSPPFGYSLVTLSLATGSVLKSVPIGVDCFDCFGSPLLSSSLGLLGFSMTAPAYQACLVVSIDWATGDQTCLWGDALPYVSQVVIDAVENNGYLTMSVRSSETSSALLVVDLELGEPTALLYDVAFPSEVGALAVLA